MRTLRALALRAHATSDAAGTVSLTYATFMVAGAAVSIVVQVMHAVVSVGMGPVAFVAFVGGGSPAVVGPAVHHDRAGPRTTGLFLGLGL